MTRTRMLHALSVAADLGNYADQAVLIDTVDPQIYLSRNWLEQPFHLVCQKDTVLTQLSGTATLHLRDSSVNSFRMQLGDLVYIPGGTPHKIVPTTESVHLRYLALDAGRVGAVWYCPGCDNELHRYEWMHDNDIPANRYYATACAQFTADPKARTCTKCATVHPGVSLDAYNWTNF